LATDISTNPFGKLNKGSRGEVTSVDHIRNTIDVKVEINGKFKKVRIDLIDNGHHLSSFTGKEQEFATGEKIVFLKNQGDIGVQNGLAGKVVDIQKGGTITVRTADDRVLTFNTNDYGFFDYGYSTTSYKVQGSEHSRVIFHADTRNFINFQSFYVATSRAREDIEIFCDKKELIFLSKSLYLARYGDQSENKKRRKDCLRHKGSVRELEGIPNRADHDDRSQESGE
jgi:hypothetical protein